MSEPRDRRVRVDDIAEAYRSRRRSLVTSHGIFQIYVDQPEEALTPTTPLRRRTMPINGRSGTGSGRVIRRVSGGRGGGYGNENVFSGGRRGGSVLPSWYPRRPLQEITSVVRAIERRRARVGEDEGQSSQSPILGSTALFEHDISVITPKPIYSRKPFPLTTLKLPEILFDITNENKEDSELLTPQKKLLNSIDKIEKVVMEELNKLQRTPTVRKAEREKRVRTLLSMR